MAGATKKHREKMTATPGRPIYHRVAVSSLFLLNGFVFASWAARIPYFKDYFHLNDGQLGSLLLCLPVGSLAILPLAGWLSTRFGSRLTAIMGSAIYCICLVWIGLAPNVFWLCTALVMMGASGNILNIAENTQGILVEGLFGRPMLSSFHGMFSLGGMVGAAFSGLMVASGILPRYNFLGVGLFALLIPLLAGSFLLKSDYGAGSDTPLFVMPDKALLKLGVIALCVMMGEGAMADWSSVYVRQYIPAHLALATAGYTSFSLAMALGRFNGDWVTLRLGTIRVLYFSGILAASGIMLAILFPVIWMVIIGFALVGAGFSIVVPLVYSSAGRSKTMPASMALAAVTTVGFLGFLAGPPLIGFTAQLITLRGALLILLVLASVISLFSKSAGNREG